MLNNRKDARTFKNEVYGAFAEVTKALANPQRLELLDLLVQGPRAVEALSRGVGRPLASTSQHLQVLKRARVVETSRRGTHIVYRLAPGVAEVFVALRKLAEARSPALFQARARFFADADAVIDAQALRDRQAAGEVTLIDVRPRNEFVIGHVPGALSIPVDELEGRLGELPPDQLLVATCRGPYCTYAEEAVRILRNHGREAVRFEDGPAEWVADGGVLEVAS